MTHAIGQLIVLIIGAAIGSPIGALILQLVCKMVVEFKPPYGMAYCYVPRSFRENVPTYLR